MRWPLLTVMMVLAGDGGYGCNVRSKLREAADIVHSRFREELATVADDCGDDGDQCRWDRDCCPGLECSLGVGGEGGMGPYCRRGVVQRPAVAASGAADVEVDGAWHEAGQGADTGSGSGQNGEWMLASAADDDSNAAAPTDGNKREEARRTDTIGELERLKERRRGNEERENAQLERLFTDREAGELQRLRALKEDAELEELRRLKELRLKRKLELIRELKELRRMKTEQQAEAIKRLEEEEEEEVTTSAVGNRTEEEPQQEVSTKRVTKQGIRGNHHHLGHKRHHHEKRKDHERAEVDVTNANTTTPTPTTTINDTLANA